MQKLSAAFGCSRGFVLLLDHSYVSEILNLIIYLGVFVIWSKPISQFTSLYPQRLMIFCTSFAGKDMNERKLMDLANGVEYVPTYEDRDGDWMLVGDVPWK